MIQSLKRSLVNNFCRAYRLMFLRRTLFIGVTGSCGKTTTKELIAAVLSTRYRGHKTPGNCNELWHIARIILRTRPRHEFCVLEAGATGPGSLESPLSLIRPRIGVVTNIGTDHFSKYGSIDAIALEKSKLVSCLTRDGTAVINADDERVLEMQSKCAGRVVTFGLSPRANLRAENVSSDWPSRLSLTALWGGQSVEVQTQLCGTHWTPNVLAALAVGLELGVSLEVAAEAIRNVPPFPGRMSPVTSPGGVTFIRDDNKAPLWTIPASLEFLHRATANRKVVVIGTISDYPGNPARKYPRVARQALEIADKVIFVGRNASKSLRARQYPNGSALEAFVSTNQLLKFLQTFLQPGDLVLLKGSEHADQLEQIASAFMTKTPNAEVVHEATHSQSAVATMLKLPASDVPNNTRQNTQLIVGLGNPGRKYQGTPHNVGQQVLDRLAESLRVTWEQEEWGMRARAERTGQTLLLVKPAAFVNDTGPLIARLANHLGIGAAHCALVFDDVALQPGDVRCRMAGSAGGHRGVQSLIDAFETEAFRRVKIGVGKPTDGSSLIDHVLRPFSGSQLELIDSACREAAKRVLELVEQRVAHQNVGCSNGDKG